MWKLSMLGLMLLGACAHQAPAPPLRLQLMAVCSAACEPAEVVAASVAVDATDAVWQCQCRLADPTTTSPTGI